MEPNLSRPLQGKRIAVLMTDGVEQVEYTGPRSFLEQQGATVVLLAPKAVGTLVQGKQHGAVGEQFAVELHVQDAHPADFDALVLPGGEENPRLLRQSAVAIDFIRDFYAEDKPIAAICHGPWLLIDAGIAEARSLTSWPGIADDLRAAGAEWVDQEVVVDERIVTSRKPEDIPAFNRALLGELMIAAEGADFGPGS